MGITGVVLGQLDPESLPGWVLYAGAAVAAAVVLLMGARLMRRGSSTPAGPAKRDLTITTAELGSTGPLASGVRLECYNIPVRLNCIVLAATGRAGDAPPESRLGELLDQVVPGLRDVVTSHRPLVRRWPAQLSAPGFTNTFFSNVKLPGEPGQKSVWTGLAGRFEADDGQKYLLGLMLSAAAPNSVGPTVIDHDGQWRDILKVRST